MATTGELRAIIEELELVDIGDAATYLGEEGSLDGSLSTSQTTVSAFVNSVEYAALADCTVCQG
ncbi:MAG TPA: hypothetical protein VL485_13060 [Ktedonobacteraceae bacterium]|jgi:hypothetical protein|nr:hypothetical protein [Ktedonobacteraceae bacterium]